MLQSPLNFLAFGFGAGLSRVAPGTCGSLVAIPIILVFAHFPDLLYLIAIVMLFIAGIWICESAEATLDSHDHPGIVWDEIVGMMIVMVIIPITPGTLILGFVLFRFFDILKPWPISYFDQNIAGGFGTMIDDVIAALIANIILRVILLYSPIAVLDL